MAIRNSGGALAATLIGTLATAAAAAETPLPEAELFFELNNTDGDLGIHANIDGPAWKRLTIETPNDRLLLQVAPSGSLRQQGLTQLSFESAEPPFDALPPAQFFARFPEGTYDIEAMTNEGTELESEVEISHALPAPPEFVHPALAPCDDPVIVRAPVTIRWLPVNTSHPTIGTPGEAIEVERYELAVERADLGLSLFLELPPTMTAFPVPTAFTRKPGVVKFEVLVKAEGGNRTAEESCFRIL